MSRSTTTEPKMFLRSFCRSHGTGTDCSCSDELSPIQRRRSSSRTPSRASSVQPEILMSTESSKLNNGVNRSLDFRSPTSYNSQQQQIYVQSTQELFSSNSRAFIDNQRTEGSVSSKRSLNFDDRDTVSCNSKHSSGGLSSYSNRSSNSQRSSQRMMVKEFNTKTSASLHAVHEENGITKIIRNNIIETDTTDLLSNGSHQRSVAYFNISNTRKGEKENSDLNEKLDTSSFSDNEEHYGESSQSSSNMTMILSFIQSCLMFLPKLIYSSLVHLFVCEKWILHQKFPISYSMLRNLFLLGLLLLCGMLLFNSYETLSTYFDKTSIPSFWEEKDLPTNGVPHEPFPPVSVPATTTTTSNAEYQKLLEKIAYLETTINDYRQTAENTYNNNLHILEQNINIKFKEEVSKIEPTKVIVEKHFVTTVEKEFVPSPPVILPAPEPEPIDAEKLSKMILPLILPEMLEKLKADLASMVKVDDAESSKKDIVESTPFIPMQLEFNLTDIEKMIRAAIKKYDADKTGLPDLALESAGGSILSTRCTKSATNKNSVLTVWGFRIWSFSNSPRTIIQPGVVPGECWVVEGATAEVVIQLVSPAVLTGFTLEHIPKAISPYGKIDTAPKDFQVIGLMHENDVTTAWDYGTFHYEDNDQPIQYFDVQNKTATAYPIVELRVLSNHGNVKSTCIYRFRVHGEKIGFK